MLAKSQKQGWAKKHAGRLETRFEHWQKPLGIDGQEYLIHLTKELEQSYDNPLKRALIESIS